MTMHLEVGLTTLNTKRRKTKRKHDSYYEPGWRKHNKFLRRLHSNPMTLKDYIDYVHGVYKSAKTKYSVKTYRPGSVVSTASTADSKPASEGSIPSTSANSPILGGGTVDWKEQQERIEISKQYTVVPAYNKGPYMVVSKSELHTAGKKV